MVGARVMSSSWMPTSIPKFRVMAKRPMEATDTAKYP